MSELASDSFENFRSHGTTIEASAISYSINMGNERKKILDNISFKIEPGELVAIMGPSGCGKSSLLDIIAGRKLVGNYSGDVFFNHTLRPKNFHNNSAYVLQSDLHIALLTVYETLYYAARFRLPENTSKENIEKRIQLLLTLMNLTHVKDTLIGDENIKGISGGQLKRVSIAVEIIDFPEIIFLDEPTSGLDSDVALRLISIVKKLSSLNRTIITTINQPSAEIFELFDKIVLLQNGKLIYFGYTKHIVAHLTCPQLRIPYEEGRNVAEYLIEASSGVLLPHDKSTPYTNNHFRKVYEESEYFYPPMTDSQRSIARRNFLLENPLAETEENDDSFPTSFKNQSQVLFHRTGVSIIRDTAEIISNIIKNLILGLLMGIIFLGQADITSPYFLPGGVLSPEVTANTSFLFFALLQPISANAQSIPYLVSKMGILRKETASGSYSFLAYWLVLSTYAIPQLLVGFIFYIFLSYFLVGYPDSAEFFIYFFIAIFLGILVSYYTAMALAAAMGTEAGALALFPAIFIFFNCFAGYTVTIPNLPWFWKQWAQWISYMRWGFQGLMINYFESKGEEGQAILKLYAFDGYKKWSTLAIMLIFVGLLLILIALAMRPPKNRLIRLDYEEHSMTLEESKKREKSRSKLDHRERIPSSEIGIELRDHTLSVYEEGTSNNVRPSRHTQESMDTISRYYNNNPQNLVFRDIHYTVSIISRSEKNQKKDLEIIKGVSGEIKSGQMCALMGASGAGKSTLLDIIAFRKTTGVITGEITLNKVSITKKNMVDQSAYVMQDSTSHWMLTVKETLKYAAFLRLPKDMSEEERESIVEDNIKILGLTDAKDTLIGNDLVQGISGSQKKRLSIGVEIIHSPNIIFLDEPTTGLDSAVSLEVIETAKRLAKLNRTVISTIHQPSPPTFALFDTLIMMANGRIIYNGTVKDALGFFTTRVPSSPSIKPLLFPYVENSNPAEFIVSIASTNLLTIDGIKIDEDMLIDNFNQSEMGLNLADHFLKQTSGKCSTMTLSIEDSKPLKESLYNTYFETVVLFKRLALIRSRYKALSLACILRSIFISILYGTLFLKLDGGYDSTLYVSRALLFVFSLMTFFMVHKQDIPDLINDRSIFYRESGAGIYGIFPYWLSRVMLTTLISAISVLCFSIILYSLTGLRKGIEFYFFFFYIIIVTDMCSYFVATLLASCSPNSQVTLNIFPTLILFSVSFEGFILFIPDFPLWLRWGTYLSFLRYSFQALVLNEFSDNSNLPLGSEFIDMMGFDSLSKTLCASILLIFLFGFGLLSFLALKYISFEKR